MPTIEANGLHVSYLAEGAGPPLVLLHGASTDAASQFTDLLPVARQGFRVIAPDARGHGGTRWDVGAGLRTDDMAADVLAVADALGLATFHLLGYSMGGMTALHVASRAADRLRTLVVVSATPEREPRLAVVRALLDPATIERTDRRWATALAARHDPVQGEGAWRRLLPAIVADVAEQRLLTPAELRAVAVPTLVVVGDRDPFAPVGQTHGLSRQVRDGRLLVLPGVGHEALAEAPTVLHAALTDFYRTHDPREDSS